MRLAFALPVVLVACTEFPELDQRITPELAAAPVPDLVPIAPLIAQANAAARVTEASASTLSGRIAALNARAARLRGPVIPAPVRTRMLRGVR
ncbi:hypothetical protein, partial [Pseudooctadecabacter sp.]|uniref:hypothetical protein n=1 Tax=Pseudooctadecabacter sp. TaxID=1966338 RepID=UPI0035C7AA7D